MLRTNASLAKLDNWTLMRDAAHRIECRCRISERKSKESIRVRCRSHRDHRAARAR
jgi:hypothetical protein